MGGNFFQYVSRVSDERSKTSTKPWLSWLMLAIILLVFIGINTEKNPYDIETLARWGVYSSTDIWNGAFWGLITSVFVHIEEWHFFGNFLWMFILSGTMELEIGRLRWFAFFILAAILSSGLQLAFSTNSGLGASGVIYAMFGFMWITRTKYSRFKTVVSNQVVTLFIVWLFACVILDFTGVLSIGNVAHFVGIIFGAMVGLSFVLNKLKLVAMSVLCAMTVTTIISLYWCPWSVAWVSKRAYDKAIIGDYKTAISLYQKSLEMGEDPVWVWKSLAIAYWNSRNNEKYEQSLIKLRELNPSEADSIEIELNSKPVETITE